jgi:hypothetical protein
MILGLAEDHLPTATALTIADHDHMDDILGLHVDDDPNEHCRGGTGQLCWQPHFAILSVLVRKSHNRSWALASVPIWYSSTSPVEQLFFGFCPLSSFTEGVEVVLAKRLVELVQPVEKKLKCPNYPSPFQFSTYILFFPQLISTCSLSFFLRITQVQTQTLNTYAH